VLCQYCGRPHREHIWTEHPDPTFKHRMPCAPQKQAMAAEQRSTIRWATAIYLAGWVAVPLAIAVAGFANWWVGFAFFLIALCKIGWRLVERFGSPEKWVPGYKERQEKELKTRHYFYDCERNPDGFARLRTENFEEDYPEDDVSCRRAGLGERPKLSTAAFRRPSEQLDLL
jgi:hypothetical protein